MDHDFGGQRDVIRRGQNGADIVVRQREGGVAVARRVQEESCVNFLRWGRQQVQVIEGTFVAEAADFVVADGGLVTFAPAALCIHPRGKVFYYFLNDLQNLEVNNYSCLQYITS